MLKRKFILILNILFFLLNNSNLQANNKIEIIKNLNNIETLKFDFVQKSFDKKETGICYLKRPHFLKCSYEDKNQKELIINKRVMVIYHKIYNKVYRYPLSKSYFLEILNREKFSKIIMKGEIQINNQSKNIEIKKNFFSIPEENQ